MSSPNPESNSNEPNMYPLLTPPDAAESLASPEPGPELPAPCRRLLELGVRRLDPWRFLSSAERLRYAEDFRAWLATRPGTWEPRALLPFAACSETGAVACSKVAPAGGEVVLVTPGEDPQILALLPSFAAWLQMAVDDFVAEVEEAAPSAPRMAPASLPGEDLPFNEDQRSTTRRHLLRKLRESEIDLDFVSTEAGDQKAAASVSRHHQQVREERGEDLYVDMLFVLTQHRYPTRVARWLWTRILEHKESMARDLGRAVEVTVASLDFLNLNEHLVQGSLVLCSEEELTQVAEVALRDGLTGLFDQSTFRLRLRRELERARRYEQPLAVLLLDLDHFKRLNDEHGHLVGDQVLATLGRILRDEVRTVDLVARYGGEEFGVILPETDPSDALLLAERLRTTVEDHFRDGLGVTVSVGMTANPPREATAEDVIAAADTGLYASKEAGRNRTSQAETSVTTP